MDSARDRDAARPDPWNDRLSEYFDGDLDAADTAAVSAHLQTCAACRDDLEAIGRVAARARTLPGSPPASDLWPEVARRIGAGGRATTRRQFAFTLPQLVAAGLALMVLSGGLVWLARMGGPGTDFPPVAATGPGGPSSGAARVYDEAAEGFQRMFDAGRGALDAGTAQVLDESVRTIEDAAEESRRALEADPGNDALRAHLWQLQVLKLDLLRRAAAIAEGVR